MNRRRGRASNFSFGRGWETSVAKNIQLYEGGSYVRSEHSWGPYDVLNTTPRGDYLTQVKASRARSKRKPRVSKKEIDRLIAAGVERYLTTGRPTTVQIALAKGSVCQFQEVARVDGAVIVID